MPLFIADLPLLSCVVLLSSLLGVCPMLSGGDSGFVAVDLVRLTLCCGHEALALVIVIVIVFPPLFLLRHLHIS